MASIPQGGDISAVLCRLALNSVTCLNEKDFDFESPKGAEVGVRRVYIVSCLPDPGHQVAACVAEDFECRLDKLEPATWKQMTTAWRQTYSNPSLAGPECYFEVQNMSALVDEGKGTTLIYFNLRWREVGSVMRDWVVEHTWKRRNTDNKWMLACTHTVRGSNIKQGFGF